MRLIDADELLTAFPVDDEPTLTKSCVRMTIQRMPTIEPERIRGRWEIYVISMLDGEGCKCSECGFEGVPYWNFCPNCGADMREQDESAD